MDSFEWNKVFAAILATAFVVLGATFLSDGIFHSENPEKPGYEIAGGAVESGGDTASAGDVIEPINTLLASASVEAGQGVAKKCAACHNFGEGEANKVGPHLYGIVNRPLAEIGDFSYSSAMKEYAAGKTWTYEELNAFLYKPKAHIKGTTMGFAGLKKVEERAEIIAYLRSLSATPAPLPDPAAAPATDAAAKPAEEGAAKPVEGAEPAKPADEAPKASN